MSERLEQVYRDHLDTLNARIENLKLDILTMCQEEEIEVKFGSWGRFQDIIRQLVTRSVEYGQTQESLWALEDARFELQRSGANRTAG